MFIAEYKSKKGWKYMNRSVIISGPDPQNLSTTTTIKIRNKSLFINILEIKKWLNKKKAYKVLFKKAKKLFFMSINKSRLAKILELSIMEKTFKSLNKIYFIINIT